MTLSIVHVYVDPNAGNDANAGSVGAPWLTVQKALDSVSGTAGNQINIKAGTAEVLSATLNWTLYSPSNSQDNPLVVRGYTTAAGDGGKFEIDGNNAVANIFSTTSQPQWVVLVDGYMHNTTGDVIDTGSNWMMIRCRFGNGGTTNTLNVTSNNHVIGCKLDSGTSGAKAIASAGSNNYQIGNFIEGHNDTNIHMAGAGCVHLFNIIESAGGHGIIAKDFSIIGFNTIVGNGTANVDGVRVGGSADEGWYMFSNIIKGWSGTGGNGVDYITGTAMLSANNVYHDNTTDIASEDVVCDLGGDTTGTDPGFTSAAGNDYSIGTAVKAVAWPANVSEYGSETVTSMDPGAAQRVEAGAGGGLIVHPGMDGGFNG